jgi:hypothetical protein
MPVLRSKFSYELELDQSQALFPLLLPINILHAVIISQASVYFCLSSLTSFNVSNNKHYETSGFLIVCTKEGQGQ